MLLCFLTLGIVLEALHGFKVGYYLDVSNETRRLMWRLAHAHGVLLSVVHIAFALTLASSNERAESAWARRASLPLTLAGLLIPGGFFLGGVIVYEADPWIGILLVPIGAIALFFAVATVALGLRKS